MKNFHCDHCGNLVFFENSVCLNCKRKLGYLPDLGFMASLEPAEGGNLWQSPAIKAKGRSYRLCRNFSEHGVCNWTVPSTDDAGPFCPSCRLTRTIPDLSRPENVRRWHQLESGKRRLLHTLFCLGLPWNRKAVNHNTGLVFDFLADSETPGAAPILSGHNGGVITINVAEADDVEREKRRTEMRESYRTVLSHFRHEIGHYYWDVLIRDSDFLEPYRQLFGDEREDYGKALQRHYKEGPPSQWQDRFVSAYASMHSWEDWAETWAHYMHIFDTLETGIACGLSLRPKRPDEPGLKPNLDIIGCQPASFDEMISRWFPLTLVLNNLNRGMGMPDAYPFILSTPAIDKLRFVHDVIARSNQDAASA